MSIAENHETRREPRIYGPKTNPVPELWARMADDGTLAQLAELTGRIYTQAYVGWMGEYNPTDHSFNYI